MSALLSPWFDQQFFDNQGRPAVGYKLFVYLAGTTTKTNSWSDAGITLNSNPIILNYRGECNLFVDSTLTYKFVLATPTDTDPPTNPVRTIDNIPGWVSQAIFNSLYFLTDDHKITAAEIAAGVTPTNYAYLPGDVRRYTTNAVGTLASCPDWTAAFQSAISAGYSPTGPAGYYGISTTLVLTKIDQTISCNQGEMILVKYANTPVVSLQTGAGVGLRNVTVYGNYAGSFAAPSRPSGAPSFTDTSDNIIIGTVGVDAPFFWQLDQVRSNWAGRDNIHHFDGPGGVMGGVQLYYAARWNYKSDQIASLPGGTSFDTAHVTAKYIEAVAGGLGTYTEGGNFYLQGATHSQFNCKSFAAFGDGFRLNTFGSNVTVFSELDGAVNTNMTTWAAGQTVVAGAMRRYLKNCYVATTSGVTGATPPTWTTGTGSDGVVTWQYRSGRSLYSESNGKNQNIIKLIFCNGYHQIQSSDQLLMGDSSDGASVEPTQTSVVAKRTRTARSPDFGDFNYSGDYGYLDIVATQGIIATFGAITAGSGYTNGTYLAVPLTGGSGNFGVVNVTVAGAIVTAVTLVGGGQNYLVGDVVSVAAGNIGGTGSGFSIPVATLATANRQYDLQHGAEGSGLPVDFYLGRNGSLGTNELLRVRADGHSILGDICHGGRVITGITSAGFSMFGQSAAYGDIFLCDATAGVVTFNIYDGGQGSLNGRRIIIVKIDASANVVTVNGLGTYNGTAFGSFNVAAQWAYTELILMNSATSAWWKKV